MASSSEADVVAALRAVVRDLGWAVADDPARLRATLSDQLGVVADAQRGPMDALVISADEGIPAALRAGVDPAELRGRLEEWGMSPQHADWVLQVWASLRVGSSGPVSGDGVTVVRDEVVVPLPMPWSQAETVPDPVPPEEEPPAVEPEPVGSEPRPRRARALVAALAVVAVIAGAVGLRSLLDGDGTGGDPPAAGTVLNGVVAVPEVDPDELTSTAAMASRKGGVRIVGLSEEAAVEAGDTTYAAPEGGRLVVFTLEDWACAVAPCTAWSELGLTVATGGSTLALPSGGPTYAVGVPEGAQADLVLSADGYTQRLSLEDGSPGADNIAVLARDNRSLQLDQSFELGETTDQAINRGNGSGTSATREVSVDRARLAFFAAGTKPSSPRSAYVVVDATFSWGTGSSCAAGCPIELGLLRLVDADGKAYLAVDLDPIQDQEHRVTAFEVPADFESGTLQIGGEVESTAGSVTFTTTVDERNVPLTFS